MMQFPISVSLLLLLELLFIRDGNFSCSLMSSHDIDELVDSCARLDANKVE